MRSSISRLRGFLAAVTCGLASGMSSVQAYDTEIYFQGATQTGPNPNILLILDSSGSMDDPVASDGRSRMAHMQEAMKLIVNQLTNVNIGLMDFANPGGGLRYPVADLSDTRDDVENNGSTTPVKDHLDLLIGEMFPAGGTPIVGAYLEGARYMLGKSVFWGTSRGIFPPAASNNYGGDWDYTNVPSTAYWGGIAANDYAIWLASNPPRFFLKWRYDFMDLPDGKTIFNQGIRFSDQRETKRIANPAGYTFVGATPSPEIVRATSCSVSNLSTSACASEYINNSGSPTLVRNASGTINVNTGDPLYVSPMSDSIECERNIIILLSDGIANSNYQQNETLIEDMIGYQCVARGGALPGAFDYGPDDFQSGGVFSSFQMGRQTCGRELAKYLFDTDQDTILDGTQNITTYTVGFNLSDTNAVGFLTDIASNGGGSYFSASTSQDLVDTLSNIVQEVRETNTTFTPPTASSDTQNRLAHRDELFFALFKPGANPAWPGNIKKYKLYEISGKVVIVGAGNRPAIDDATGFFIDGESDLFNSTGTPDGSDVALGGVASKLGIARALYTFTGTVPVPPASPINLQTAVHQLDKGNANVSKGLLGIPTKSDSDRDELLDWARGIDPNGAPPPAAPTPTNHFGHPIHGGPVAVTYQDDGTTEDVSVFSVNNKGFFSIINAATGIEEFGWIPQALLPNLDAFKTNISSDPLFGLDGNITVEAMDGNDDGDLYDPGIDRVNAFFGMRRGGRNYYALDLQDRNAPKLKWVIQGGTGAFAELGETWSQPVLTKVQFGTVERTVLLFAGGYDADQDNWAVRTIDDQGRGIFMVDADTGVLLWRAGPDVAANLTITEMQYSIPAKVSILDHNSDGLVDRLYVGDMGGNVFRIDFRDSNTGAGDLATGGVLAALGGATALDTRRFYNAPDVALIDAGGPYISVALGSGFRAHPLDVTTQDYFFALRDTHITEVVEAADYGTTDPNTGRSLFQWDFSDLVNLNANTIGQGATPADRQAALDALRNKDGWYLPLDSGEKVLSSSLTFAGNLLWTTYTPPGGGTPAVVDVCDPNVDIGTAYIYLVDAFSAVPKMDLNASGNIVDLTDADRRQKLVQATIPPQPRVILFDKDPTDDENPTPVVVIGTEALGVPEGELLYRTFWREEAP